MNILLGLFSCNFSNFNLKFESSSVFNEHIHGGSTPWVESGAIIGHFDDHDRGDKTRTSTTGDRTNSRAHAHRPQNIVPRRWRLKDIMAAASPIFRPARSANNHENLADGGKKRRIRPRPR